jgi:hypothetical protein
VLILQIRLEAMTNHEANNRVEDLTSFPEGYSIEVMCRAGGCMFGIGFQQNNIAIGLIMPALVD